MHLKFLRLKGAYIEAPAFGHKFLSIQL